MKIFPSLIASDVLNLEHTIKTFEPHCDGFHLDVMDWHFVPNLTLGPLVINPLARLGTKPLLIHLMIENVKPFLSMLQIRDIDILSFHIELDENISDILHCIKEKKWRSNLAICPKTDLEKLFPWLKHIDSVLLMSVEPGFSGQQFIENSVDRAQELLAYRQKHNLSFKLCMDGGINQSNISMLKKLGVDEVTVGSGIFDQDDPFDALKKLMHHQ